ncbi:MAG: hypothetical protein KME64_32175 [Scytonematopsis contorta HA4267-MV1]|nr:hypothetical protein [Scytonematopsis contorta HA4267-MV1]
MLMRPLLFFGSLLQKVVGFAESLCTSAVERLYTVLTEECDTKMTNCHKLKHHSYHKPASQSVSQSVSQSASD